MLKSSWGKGFMKFNFELEDIKYIKISYKDSFGNTNSIKAAIKNVNNREITACSKFENNLKINTPQEITLSIVSKDGIYKTNTILKSAEEDEPYIFFFLDTPQGFEYEQNREFFRVQININCDYIVKQNDDIIKINSETVNISANGICIKTPSLIISEENTHICFSISDKTIKTNVKYIRSEKTNDGYLVSFSYVNLSEADRDLISQTCIKKQLEQKRNSLF